MERWRRGDGSWRGRHEVWVVSAFSDDGEKVKSNRRRAGALPSVSVWTEYDWRRDEVGRSEAVLEEVEWRPGSEETERTWLVEPGRFTSDVRAATSSFATARAFRFRRASVRRQRNGSSPRSSLAGHSKESVLPAATNRPNILRSVSSSASTDGRSDGVTSSDRLLVLPPPLLRGLLELGRCLLPEAGPGVRFKGEDDGRRIIGDDVGVAVAGGGLEMPAICQ